MKNNKLLSILHTFSDIELAHFSQFVSLDWINNNEQLCHLAQFLEENLRNTEQELIDELLIHKALYPKQPFDKKKIGYLMSDLLKLVEKFFGFKQLEKKNLLFELQTLRELMERNADKQYRSLFKNIQKKLEADYKEESDAFYHQYLLAEIAVDHFGTREIRKYDENLQIASNALDNFYFIQKLKYSCEMLNRQAILADQFSIPFMEEVKNYLAQHQPEEPLLYIYLQIYFSLSFPQDEKYFKALRKGILTYQAKIKKEEMRSIYLYAINICARKIRQGQEKYLEITLSLYEEGIKTKALYDKNYLSHWTYNNILKLALRLERFEWFEAFIYKYNKALKPQFRADALQYNLAEFYFYKNDYENALLHLNKVNFKDINYLLGARILLIKSFYESEAIEAMLNTLASFKVYLRRNNAIASTIKKSCLNFCDLLYQIFKLNRPKKEWLQEQITNTQPLTEKSWLMKVFEKQSKLYV